MSKKDFIALADAIRGSMRNDSAATLRARAARAAVRSRGNQLRKGLLAPSGRKRRPAAV